MNFASFTFCPIQHHNGVINCSIHTTPTLIYISLSDILTDCPPVYDAMDGGEITLSTTEQEDSEQKGIQQEEYDCVWLIRYPDYNWNWATRVYVHVMAANLIQGNIVRYYSHLQKLEPLFLQYYTVNMY